MKKKDLIGLIAAIPMAIPVEMTKVIHRKIKDNATRYAIKENHLFHFTSREAADKILESGYIKPSGIVNSHFTSPKAYMYLGMPDIETFRKNVSNEINPFLNNIYEFNAVEIMPTEEDLEKLKIRKYNDNVIVKNGRYNIPKGTETIVQDDNNVIETSSSKISRIVISKDKNGKLEFQKFDENIHKVDENGKYMPDDDVKELLDNYVKINNSFKENTKQVVLETNNLLHKFKNYFKSKINKKQMLPEAKSEQPNSKISNDKSNVNEIDKLKELTNSDSEIANNKEEKDITNMMKGQNRGENNGNRLC